MTNRITKYDMADILMEHFPPDTVGSRGMEAYSKEQIKAMLHYDNKHHPAEDRVYKHFENEFALEGSVVSHKLRLYLYGG